MSEVPSLQGLAPDSPALQRAAAALEDYDFSKEGTLEERCTEAFAAVQHFEKTHCLALQVRPVLQQMELLPRRHVAELTKVV